jgi:hypothetical protein
MRRECLPIDQLHGQQHQLSPDLAPVGIAWLDREEVEHATHVRMGDPTSDLDLDPEAQGKILVVTPIGTTDLQSDTGLQLSVVGGEDLAHAPLAEEVVDLEPTGDDLSLQEDPRKGSRRF